MSYTTAQVQHATGGQVVLSETGQCVQGEGSAVLVTVP